MSAEGVKQVIGRAVIDEEFPTLLFDKPTAALGEFDLTDEERTRLQTVTRDEFDQVTSEVEERVSRAGMSAKQYCFDQGISLNKCLV